MNQLVWKWLGFVVSLFLAGLSIIFKDSTTYGIFLVILAFLILVSLGIWLLWEYLPKIYIDINKPKQVARFIYKTARKQGGVIYATHIFPKDKKPENDFAIDELRNIDKDVKLTFHRVILLDSITDEQFWLETLFSSLPQSIDKCFYTLSSYPLLLPRIAKTVIPRLNLLLYDSGKHYQVLIGLDRLHLIDSSFNFAVYSKSKRVYDALRRYYEKITGSMQFRKCQSIEEYHAKQPASNMIQRGQSVISNIIELAETTRGILFVGIFGSIARTALGLTPNIYRNSDADVDILLIYDPEVFKNIQEIKDDIKSKIDGRLNIVWGPDESIFYPFRDPLKTNVDMEILPHSSNFFKHHILLGNSVFRHFMPLYSIGQKSINQYLGLHLKPMDYNERWKVLIEDRQGLKYFKSKIKNNPNHTDPRRLCTHVIRNTVWAITGIWSITAIEAAEYLLNLTHWEAKREINDGLKLLEYNDTEMKIKLENGFKIIESLIDASLHYYESMKLTIGSS